MAASAQMMSGLRGGSKMLTKQGEVSARAWVGGVAESTAGDTSRGGWEPCRGDLIG